MALLQNIKVLILLIDGYCPNVVDIVLTAKGYVQSVIVATKSNVTTPSLRASKPMMKSCS